MRVKYKNEQVSGILQVPDGSTIGFLFEKLKPLVGNDDFIIKYGLPTAMKSIEKKQKDQLVESFKLNGETLTIVSVEKTRNTEEDTTGHRPMRRAQTTGGSSSETGESCIAWPEREGTLVLRVMPSDNSCLFTAFGGALPEQIPPQRLRQMMADYIQSNPDIYTDAVLGNPPSRYCERILNPDAWGGGIELSILSTIFNLQICTFDVQTKNNIIFGENNSQRCILVYSGIHYDRIAFSYSDYPHKYANLPPELDRALWPADDADVLNKASSLVEILHQTHYYTDFQSLVLKCNIPGCNWIGAGQREGQKHADETGHTSLSEIEDDA
ncbi:hypothetical protein VHEMI02899 [[Torrubiella] hemipterigena]|uniref:Ubiquitin thioesterase OTU n=1 Tax=[Torrubiella] hemipterigena TaxID=1531966 RepID=A0A0A1SQY7_9HYPO|nr:hypothetical protein VHEMI02899 [[Torrubiella] hemipterigena]